jgi:hypothetical protein
MAHCQLLGFKVDIAPAKPQHFTLSKSHCQRDGPPHPILLTFSELKKDSNFVEGEGLAFGSMDLGQSDKFGHIEIDSSSFHG